MLTNEKILIFGGSGSLGHALVKRYVSTNEIVIYSRDESKHWSMQQTFDKWKCHMSYVIGDIRDKEKVKKTIMQSKPTYIIIASALKHIDKCENDVHECIMTNIIGTKNIIDSIEELQCEGIKAICFISTDKACSPVNVYGMSKGICEGMMIEKALKNKGCKFVCVRYGNVLNSRGSIIPLLHSIGANPEIDYFTITDERMTRFIMTLDESVDLIEHALVVAESGDIVISKLKSMWIKDLIELFSEIYKKDVKLGKLRPGEKLLEALVNETQSSRLVKDVGTGYMYIKPHFSTCSSSVVTEYNSTHGLVTKDELREILQAAQLLSHSSSFQ